MGQRLAAPATEARPVSVAGTTLPTIHGRLHPLMSAGAYRRPSGDGTGRTASLRSTPASPPSPDRALGK